MLPVLALGTAAVVLVSRMEPSVPPSPGPIVPAGVATGPHGDPSKCATCHPRARGHVEGDPIALCRSCHGPSHADHPVGVAQADPADPGLPLGPGGVVVCHSCHDPHDVARTKSGLRLAFTPLCLRCHPRH
jgi:predicted CXXCH cytochrome family protein